MADMPEYMTELGYAAGRLVPDEIVATANQAGQGIDAQKISRLVHPMDVAPTITAFLGMTAPAAAKGSPLIEVLE